jgi:RNA polymerase-binding transcription factor DksA
LKKALLRKGAEINEKLTQLLAGKQVDIPMLQGKAGESPIEKLKRFMRLVDESLQRIARGTYGTCASCGDGLPYVHLEQIPWIDTCQACAAKAVAEGT